jgi:hypothetical protein
MIIGRRYWPVSCSPKKEKSGTSRIIINNTHGIQINNGKFVVGLPNRKIIEITNIIIHAHPVRLKPKTVSD